MNAREWKPGDPVPDKYAGMPVTFAWNAVALSTMLRILREHYPSGHTSMVDHVRKAMTDFNPTPSKPDEPTGLGAVVEDAEGADWHRTREGRWIAEDGLRSRAGGWDHIAAVRILSPGVTQ